MRRRRKTPLLHELLGALPRALGMLVQPLGVHPLRLLPPLQQRPWAARGGTHRRRRH